MIPWSFAAALAGEPIVGAGDMDVVLVIDRSCSMIGPEELVADGVEALATELGARPGTSLGVLLFHDQVVELLPLQPASEVDPARLARQWVTMCCTGRTRLDIGVAAAHELLLDSPASVRRIVWISDGFDARRKNPASGEAFLEEVDLAWAEGLDLVVVGAGHANLDLLRQAATGFGRDPEPFDLAFGFAALAEAVTSFAPHPLDQGTL